MPSEPNLVHLFQFRAQCRPNDIAVEDCTGDKPLSITYAELDALSDRWSRTLRQAGVTVGSIVPLLSTRCIGMVALTLAILKCRATYVPIDMESCGQDRLESILNTIQPHTIAYTSEVDAPPSSNHSIRFEMSDGLAEEDRDLGLNSTASLTDTNESQNSTDDIANIIFTSGTTGKPKGVVVRHQSIALYVQEGGKLPFNFNTTFGIRVLLICSIGFDACVGILFSSICNGGTVVLANQNTLQAAAKLCHVLPLTPSILATLDPNDGFDTVEQIFLGGESPTRALIDAWSTPKRKLFNCYGPTEATCTTLMARLNADTDPTDIGCPVSYAEVLLINEAGEESDEGEITIAGPGLAEGYFADIERTNQAFVEISGRRMYKTGDFGRLVGGQIRFLGRRDHVVKNRGFLINLEADVEPALTGCPQVQSAVAMMSLGELVAFVSPTEAANDIRRIMVDCGVSEYLIPDKIFPLNSMPMTANGKANRHLLKELYEKDLQQEAKGLDLEVLDALPMLDKVRHCTAHVLRVQVDTVSPESSFRTLGGNSLSAVMLSTHLRKIRVDATVSQVLLLDKIQTIATQARPISRGNSDTLNGIDGTHTKVPITDMQMSFLRSTMLSNEFGYITTSFTFDHPNQPTVEPTLHRAWTLLHARHKILKTSFLLETGEQRLIESVSPAWEHIASDERDWHKTCEQQEMTVLLQNAPFNEQDLRCLSSMKVVSSPHGKTRLIWRVHHSIIDGWSMKVLLHDFAALLDDRPLLVATQFSQVVLQQQTLKHLRRDEVKAFWKEYLQGRLPAPSFKTAPSRPQFGTQFGNAQSERVFVLDMNIEALEAAASRFKVSAACILHAAWGLTVSRYCCSSQVLIGAVLSGRNLPIDGIENVIGPLITTLPLAIDSSKGQTTEHFLSDTFRNLCSIMDLSLSSTRDIQDAVGADAGNLFETIFASQYDFPTMEWPSNTIGPPCEIRYCEATETPLTALLDRQNGILTLRLLYLKSHFHEYMVSGIGNCFEVALRSLVNADIDTLLHDVHSAMSCYDTISSQGLPAPCDHLSLDLCHAVESAAMAYPDLPAVEGISSTLTYRELMGNSDRLMTQLIQFAGPGDVICLIADGSVSWLQAILSIIRLGAVYCPVDHKLPLERQKYMIQNAGASLILYTGQDATICDFGVPKMLVDEDMSSLAMAGAGQKRHRVPRKGSDVACVIYTSGSTGLPKAVQLTHGGILNVLRHDQGRLYSGPGRRIAQTLALGFDCCLKEVLSSLCFGATLVLKDPQDPIAHLSRVDTMMATPSLLATLDPRDYAHLRHITVAGEAVNQRLSDAWAPGRTLVNAYGPAECTLITTSTLLREGDTVSIGKPLNGQTAYLLDSQGYPVPPGVDGELCFSGMQVSPGYLNNVEETMARFASDPVHGGQSMYFTGDYARVNEDGNLEYLGREDAQIKLRGFRIDLGEVQNTALRLAKDAKNVAVVEHHGSLVAFVSPEVVDVKLLERELRLHLPAHAVPSRVIAMASLPTSTNHKVDTKFLKASLDQDRLTLQACRTDADVTDDVYQAVSKIWSRVLGYGEEIINLPPDKTFIQLGGHSLLQIQVARAIGAEFSISPLPLREVVANPTISALVDSIHRLLASSTDNTPSPEHIYSSNTGTVSNSSVSWLEKEMFINHSLMADSRAGNMCFSCKIAGDVDVERLRTAIAEVTMQSEIFQSRYKYHDGAIERVLSPSEWQVALFTDISNVEESVQEYVNQDLDLAHDTPVNAAIFVDLDGNVTLSIVMAHITGDAMTMTLYLQNIAEAYRLLRERAIPLSVKATDVASYMKWATDFAVKACTPDLETFWTSYLTDVPPSLTFGEAEAQPLTYKGDRRRWTVSESLFAQLRSLATEMDITMHQLALAATFLTLQAVDQRDDVVLAAPYMHRQESGTDSMYGLFLDRLIIRLACSHTELEDLHTFFAATRSKSSEALAHVMPFASIMKSIKMAPSLTNPLQRVMVTYHTRADAQAMLQLEGTTVEPLHFTPTGSAKFPLLFEMTETAQETLRIDMEFDLGCMSTATATRLEISLALVLQLLAKKTAPREICSLLRGIAHTCGKPLRENFVTTSAREKNAMLSPEQLQLVICACATTLGLAANEIDPALSFWDHGAQSIDALRLQFQLSKSVPGLNLALRDVFGSRNIRELAARGL